MHQMRSADTPRSVSTQRRRYPRFAKEFPVRYKIIKPEDLPHRGRTVNISGGGLCFTSESEIPEGKTVALALDLPNVGLFAVGKIMWTKPAGEDFFESGVQFLFSKQREKEEFEAEELDSLVSRLEGGGISSVVEE